MDDNKKGCEETPVLPLRQTSFYVFQLLPLFFSLASASSPVEILCSALHLFQICFLLFLPAAAPVTPASIELKASEEEEEEEESSL